MSRLLSSDERSAKHLASAEVRSHGSWKVDGIPTCDEFILARSSERLRSSSARRAVAEVIAAVAGVVSTVKRD